MVPWKLVSIASGLIRSGFGTYCGFRFRIGVIVCRFGVRAVVTGAAGAVSASAVNGVRLGSSNVEGLTGEEGPEEELIWPALLEIARDVCVVESRDLWAQRQLGGSTRQRTGLTMIT